MTPHQLSFKLSPTLHEIVRVEWPQHGYASEGDYFRGLVRLSVMLGCSHELPVRIARLSGHERDAFDEKLRTPEGLEELRREYGL